MSCIKKTSGIGSKAGTFTVCFFSMAATPLTYARPNEPTVRTAHVKEWLAFGSGCRSSSKAPQSDLSVETSYSGSIKTALKMSRFVLELPTGGKGVRECAFRMVIAPPPDVKVKHVQARTRLLANKTSQEHMRGRIILLLGENIVDQRVWDLEKNDFAKFRDESITLVAGAKSEFETPATACGKEQIVGLDFTLEGVSEIKSTENQRVSEEKLFLRVPSEAITEINVITEECHPKLKLEKK